MSGISQECLSVFEQYFGGQTHNKIDISYLKKDSVPGAPSRHQRAESIRGLLDNMAENNCDITCVAQCQQKPGDHVLY